MLYLGIVDARRYRARYDPRSKDGTSAAGSFVLARRTSQPPRRALVSAFRATSLMFSNCFSAKGAHYPWVGETLQESDDASSMQGGSFAPALANPCPANI